MVCAEFANIANAVILVLVADLGHIYYLKLKTRIQ